MNESAVQETDELKQRALEFLSRLLKAARLDLEVACEAREDGIHLRIDGRDVDALLSDNARVLYAVNNLLNQAFSSRAGRPALLVDCNDFRATRVLELQLLARKAAEQVRIEKSSFTLQPMPAFERRVVHLALAEEEGVRTESRGTGSHRHVVILPAGSR